MDPLHRYLAKGLATITTPANRSKQVEERKKLQEELDEQMQDICDVENEIFEKLLKKCQLQASMAIHKEL